MNGKNEKKRGLAGMLIAMILVLLPVVAFAVETDRLTVEDPNTQAIKFKVTSEGNVTGASFAGDGSGLTNVPHWKGIWSGATPYAKDDTVSYSGSSYIALQASTNFPPAANPTYWAVMASQGPAGAAGTAGAQGPQGPAGSPDTSSQIFTKLATATTGAVMSVQATSSDSVLSPKFSVRDSSGADRLYFVPNGYLYNTGTYAEIHNRVYNSGTARPVIASERARGTATTPLAVQLNDKLGTTAFVGYDGSAYQTGALFEAYVDDTVSSGFVPSRLSIVTGSNSSTRAERLVVKYTGDVGIGTTSPSQKLEINGGVRLNTATAKPDCSNSTLTTRGTFWVSQGATDDIVQVCVMTGGVLGWKIVQMQ